MSDLLTTFLVKILPTAIIIAIFSVSILAYKKRGRYSPFTQDFLREPGETLRNQLEKLQFDFLSTIILAMFISLLSSYVVSDVPVGYRGWVGTILVIVAIYFIYKALRYFNKSVKVRLGLEGERATGEELNMLMHDGAWVFHDIPYQYGNIDHIVISTGGIFAVETKAVSKPKSETKRRAEYKMEFDGETLKFPHWQGDGPLKQARIHAKYLRKVIQKNLCINTPAIPVVAIPGWFISNTGKSDIWVINPKNRKVLIKQLKQNRLSEGEVSKIAAYIESVARSVRPVSKKLDPDASDYYDFWNNPRYKPPSVG